MKLSFTKHAIIRMNQRKFTIEDIYNVVNEPDEIIEQYDGCIRYYKYAGKFKKVVRVVCRGASVITVMPDRSYSRRKK